MAQKMPIYEFVAMLAMMFALVAFSTDAMLPAFPQMAADLVPDAPNSIPLVISAFIFGLGLGTFLAGPFSDAIGRKGVVAGGVAIFVLGCGLSWAANSLEMLLAGRVLQGLGAAGPRIGPMAMMRDLYEGRRMAQLTSIIMAVFMLFPAVAPFIGQQIIRLSDWRMIFVAFAAFAVFSLTWLMVRQPETLAPADRRALKFGPLLDATRLVMSNPMVMLYTAALTLGFTELLAIISNIQQVYDQTFGIAEAFPMWFALGALIASLGTIANASLVMRFGMRRLALLAFGIKALFTLSVIILFQSQILGPEGQFVIWFVWATSVFFMMGMIFGNLNALALQPLGHVAGTAASLVTGLSTVGAALLIIPVGLAFDGTPLPLMINNLIAASLAFMLMRRTVDDYQPA